MAENNFQSIGRPMGWNAATWGSARFPLSASPLGEPIDIPSGSVGAGTIVHTIETNVNSLEEIYIYASNYTSAAQNITMSLATSSAGAFVGSNQIVAPVAAQNGPILCFPGIPIHSPSDNPVNLYITTNANNTINVFGYVLRYYPKSTNRNDTKYGYVIE
jgi:hypothetical protein